MKHTFVTALLILMLASTAIAQEQRGRGQDGAGGPRHDPAQRLSKELDLNEEQTTQVTAIFEGARSQHEEMRKLAHEERCAIRANVEVQLADVLSSDQYLQFQELRLEHESRRGGRGPAADDCEPEIIN